MTYMYYYTVPFPYTDVIHISVFKLNQTTVSTLQAIRLECLLLNEFSYNPPRLAIKITIHVCMIRL